MLDQLDDAPITRIDVVRRDRRRRRNRRAQAVEAAPQTHQLPLLVRDLAISPN